jgi:hypothetical protein
MVQALDLVRKLQVMVACVTVPDDKQTNMSKRPPERTFPILAASVVHGPAPRALRHHPPPQLQCPTTVISITS